MAAYRHTVKAGDTVAAFIASTRETSIEQAQYNNAHPDYVKVARVTPSGQIILENGQRFNANMWYGGAHHAIGVASSPQNKKASPRYDRIVPHVTDQQEFEDKVARDEIVKRLNDLGNGYRRRQDRDDRWSSLTHMENDDVRLFEQVVGLHLHGNQQVTDETIKRINKAIDEAWNLYERARLSKIVRIAEDVLSLDDLRQLMEALNKLNREIDERDAAVTITGQDGDAGGLTSTVVQ